MKDIYLYTILYGRLYLQKASAVGFAITSAQASPDCISGLNSLSGFK